MIADVLRIRKYMEAFETIKIFILLTCEIRLIYLYIKYRILEIRYLEHTTDEIVSCAQISKSQICLEKHTIFFFCLRNEYRRKMHILLR